MRISGVGISIEGQGLQQSYGSQSRLPFREHCEDAVIFEGADHVLGTRNVDQGPAIAMRAEKRKKIDPLLS